MWEFLSVIMYILAFTALTYVSIYSSEISEAFVNKIKDILKVEPSRDELERRIHELETELKSLKARSY